MKYTYIAVLFIFCNFAYANDRTEIETVIKSYSSAVSASDAKAVTKLFSQDGVFIPAKKAMAKGLEDIERAFNHEFNILDLNVKPIIDKIVISGDLAFVRMRSLGYIIIRKTNEKKATTSYRAVVTLNRIDNSWKISTFIFNFAK